MTTALGSTDLSNLRGTGPHTYSGYLVVVPQTSFATARMNQASFVSPLAQVTVDTTSADWLNVLPGMTCWVGTSAGASDVGIYRVRATPTGATLYLQELSTGDFGRLPNTSLTALADNQYITIVSDFNLWSVFPRIVYSGGLDGTFYKDYDDGYTDQNETGGAVPGVVNIGGHVSGTISGSTLSASFTAIPHAFDGSVSSYAWDFDDGTPGTATGAGPHSVTFPEGNRWIRCAVTFSGGAVVTGYRHVWALGNTNQPYQITSASSRKTKQGRRMTARIVGSAYNTNPIRLGAMVMFAENITYNGTATIASAASTFTGWVTRLTLRGQANGLNEFEVEIVGALELSREMVLHGQQLVVSANPTHWQEVSAGLAHVDFYTYYLLHYHTTLPRLFDFQRSTLTSYTTSAWKSDRGGVTDEIGRVIARLNLQFTQDSDGTMRLVREPSMLETTALRNALVTRITLNENDVQNVTLGRNLWPRIGQVQASGFSSATDPTQIVPHKSYAPGQTGGQGAGIDILDNQLLGGGSLTSAAELNARAANLYAKNNRAYESVTFDLARGNYENVIEPSQPIVIGLSIGATYSPTGEALNLTLDPTEVNIRYEPNGVKVASLTAEVITSGYPAPGQAIPITVGNDRPIDDIQFPPYDPTTGLIDIPYDPFGYNPPLTGNTAAPFSTPDTQSAGYLVAGGDDGTGLTRTPAAPQFVQIHAPTAAITLDAIFDSRSPKLTSNKTSGALRGWILTDDALYSAANFLEAVAPAITQRQSNFTGYKFLRGPLGVSTAVSVYGTDATTATGDIVLTFDGGDDPSYTVNQGTVGAGGRSGDGLNSEIDTGNVVANVDIDLGSETTLQAFSFWVNASYAGATHEVVVNVTGYESDGTTQTGTLGNTTETTSNGSYTQLTYLSLNWANTQIITVNCQNPTFVLNNFTLDDMAADTTMSSQEAAVWYSSDNAVNGSILSVGGNPTQGGYDVDDYNLGVHVASNGSSLRNTTTYTGSFSSVTGPTAPTGGVEFNLVRVPYRVLTSTAANSSSTALHVVWGASGSVSGSTLWRGTLNAGTHAMSNITDITPIISGTTYYPIGPNGLEMNPNDARVMLMLGVPIGGGATRLLHRDSSGTWSVVQNPADYTFVKWATGNAAWLAGDSGIGFTPDQGTTLEDRTGDFTATVSALPVAFALGTGK